jgi:hypothetical protein
MCVRSERGPATDFGGSLTAEAQNISKKWHPHRDLSTALRSGRDDKGEGGCGPEQSLGEETAGLSTALRSGRDDKGEGGASIDSSG